MGKDPPNDSPDFTRRSLLVGRRCCLGHARRCTCSERQRGAHRRADQDLLADHHCETAIRQKLFEKEGIKAELTIYRSGAEGFEAIAAGAADLSSTPRPAWPPA